MTNVDAQDPGAQRLDELGNRGSRSRISEVAASIEMIDLTVDPIASPEMAIAILAVVAFA